MYNSKYIWYHWQLPFDKKPQAQGLITEFLYFYLPVSKRKFRGNLCLRIGPGEARGAALPWRPVPGHKNNEVIVVS